MKYDGQAKRLMSLESRLIANSVPAPSGCREWTEGVNDYGYGRMSYQGKVYRAHRLAAHQWLGLDLSDPEAKVCHHCDNPPRINPDHLYLGDQKSNVRDMHSRGRGYPGPAPSTHCRKGHLVEGDNALVFKSGKRRCRTCVNETQREYRKSMRKPCSDCGKVLTPTGMTYHMKTAHPVKAIQKAMSDD